MKAGTKTLLAVAMLSGASGCGEPEKETITLGAVVQLSGALAGPQALEALKLAASEINEAGGVLDGKQIEIAHKDDGSDPERTKENVQAFIDEGVTVQFGATASFLTIPAAEVAAAGKAVLISHAASSPILTTLADDGYVFRTCASDALQGELIAKRAVEKGYKTVAVIHIDDVYGKGLANVFAESFDGEGRTTRKVEIVSGGSSYADAIADAFTGSAPDAILLVAFTQEATQVLNDYVSSGRQTTWLFPDALGEDVVQAVGSDKFSFANEFVVPAQPEETGFNRLKTNYEKLYGSRVDAYTASAYDSLYLAALAIEAAKSAEGTKVRDALPGVSKGGEKFGPEKFKEAIQALRDGKDIDYQGVGGPMDFDENGDVVTAYDVRKWENGAFVTVASGVSP